MNPRLLAIALLFAASTGAMAADFDPADFLAKQCSRCHDSTVYTRPDRRVQSLEALHNQVRRCDAMIGTKLYDEDLDALVKYLNTQYYHF